MTPADIDLARRLAASPHFRWMEGMQACERAAAGMGIHRERLRRVTADWSPGVGWLPDLDDAATRGALLDVAREMWHCDDYRRLTVEVAGAGWCIIVRNGRHRPPSRARPGWDLDRVAHPPYLNAPKVLADECPTEGAAIAAAILAAPAVAVTTTPPPSAPCSSRT